MSKKNISEREVEISPHYLEQLISNDEDREPKYCPHLDVNVFTPLRYCFESNNLLRLSKIFCTEVLEGVNREFSQVRPDIKLEAFKKFLMIMIEIIDFFKADDSTMSCDAKISKLRIFSEYLLNYTVKKFNTINVLRESILGIIQILEENSSAKIKWCTNDHIEENFYKIRKRFQSRPTFEDLQNVKSRFDRVIATTGSLDRSLCWTERSFDEHF